MDAKTDIRQAGLADIPLIRGMADVVFRKTYSDILSPFQMEYMMDWMYSEESLAEQVSGDGRWFYVAFRDGVPAGYVSFEREASSESGSPSRGRDRFHLQKLYVMPSFQGLGLGRELLSFVQDRLSELSPEGFRMELNVNRANPAVSFYEHLGLVRDREGDFPIGGGYYMNDYIYVLLVQTKK